MALISPTFFAAAEVARNFPAFDQLYDALKCTMRKYSATDSIVQPVRTQIHVPDTSARFITMPVCDASRGIMGLKIVSAVPSNITTLLPTSLGCVQLYDFTGQLLCQMECGEITAKRTAVSSAVATELLASPQSKILAVLGAGVQAESHVWALRQLYDFSEVRIWNRTETKAAELSEKLDCTACKTVEEACRDADIVCTVTGSTDPILHRVHIKPGAHINAVGSSSPACREISDDIMLDSDVTLVADCKRAVLAESGDFIQSGAKPRHEIGELLDCGYTRQESGITLFKNVGLGCQDLTSAHLVFQNYQAQNHSAS